MTIPTWYNIYIHRRKEGNNMTVTPKWLNNVEFINWLKTTAADELPTHEYHHLIAQYVMADEDTTLEVSPKEAGF